mmetsp:Transcript_8765/g.17388  ORF Transcript_8765/g.17388 Transcript_8765/m.17388 type:complete len:195 (-) Transcript_8765:107-691(-)
MANKKDDDAEEEASEETPGMMRKACRKALHVLFFTGWLAIHCGMLRHHQGTQSIWNFIMITCETAVLGMHAVGLTKTALLISVGEMAGGHFQHLTDPGYPNRIAALLSTFPVMNLYILLASLAYLTAPWTKPECRPRPRKVVKAMVVGVVLTVALMFASAALPPEAVAIFPIVYMLPGPGPRLQKRVIGLLNEE